MIMEYSVWKSSNRSAPMIAVDPAEFREKVSSETKDRAKDQGLIFLDTTSSEPAGVLLEVYGLEEYLQKRIQGDL
mgnify:CR=1 FL=1